MSKSVKRVQTAAQKHGLDIEILRMGGSTRTAEDAAKACGCAAAQIVKSLIFKGRSSGDLILLLVSGANQVDLEKASTTIGEPLDRADANEVRARTGFSIGGVSPVGHLEAPTIWMDQSLTMHSIVWAAGGAPDAVFQTTPEALAQMTGARLIDLALQ